MHLFKRENVEVGFTVLSKRVVSIEDVTNFAKISGDFNPIHMDEEFASKSIFKRRVAHGLLIASFISKVLGGEEFGIDFYLSFSNPRL
jgi:3-hydroxybutyryl-CoA dehydratase